MISLSNWLCATIYLVVQAIAQDCGRSIDFLSNLERRARNMRGANPYIDDFALSEGWFSVNKNGLQYLMPDGNSMPDYVSCGTMDPIYVQGTHPDIKLLTNVSEDITACLRDTFSDCKIKYNIQVRKCGNEVQYWLENTRVQSAYCFDPPYLQNVNKDDFKPAPENVSLGKIEVIPQLHFHEIPKRIPLRPSFIMTDTINFIPYIRFLCKFMNDPRQLYYRVMWMVNDDVVLVKTSQSVTELYVTEEDLMRLHIPLGINIRCGVLVSHTQNGAPTPMVSSENYFAGIKLKETVISVPKTKGTEVQFSLTVPIGCGYNSHLHDGLEFKREYCRVGLRMFDPAGHKCDTGNIVQIHNNQRCGSLIETLTNETKHTWSKDHLEMYALKVQTADEKTTDPRSYSLHLKMDDDKEHKWWNGHLAPIVTAYVDGTEDPDLRDHVCYAHVDPHMRTTDNYCYESQKQGRYIMYKNKKYRIEVQYETGTCNHGIAQCICAVAIRAGGDVFVIDLCVAKHIIDFVSCTDNGILKVENKSESRYQVHTPIGTWIDIVLRNDYAYEGFMNVDITMSAKDFKETEGLCGFYDGKSYNDLMRRDGHQDTLSTDNDCREHKHYEFTDSWRVDTSKGDIDLLDHTKPIHIGRWQDYNGLFCVCDQAKINGTDGLKTGVGNAVCKGTQYIDCIVYSGYHYENCKITHGKRSVAQIKAKREQERYLRKIGHLKLLKSTSTGKRLKREETKNITEAEALGHCTTAINSSVAVTNNDDTMAGEDPNNVIQQCVFDVLAGNDLSLSNVHVDSINNIVQRVLETDPIYVANNTEKVELFVKSSCPSNCSRKGICNENGTCECLQYMHGSDCGFDERDPLNIFDMEGDGLCNKTDGDGCSCFVVRTKRLLPKFKCLISGNMTYVDGTYENITIGTHAGEYGDMFTAICCLPEDHRRKRSVEGAPVFIAQYDVSISNDGNNFGESAPIFIFDSACQIPVAEANGLYNFLLKDDTCFIDGKCIFNQEQSSTDPCFSCVPGTAQYNWTMSCPPVSDDMGSDVGVILGASVGSVSAFVIVVAVVLLWKFHFQPKIKKRKSIGDSTVFTDANTVHAQQ